MKKNFFFQFLLLIYNQPGFLQVFILKASSCFKCVLLKCNYVAYVSIWVCFFSVSCVQTVSMNVWNHINGEYKRVCEIHSMIIIFLHINIVIIFTNNIKISFYFCFHLRNNIIVLFVSIIKCFINNVYRFITLSILWRIRK